jgi:hypothetical protein
MNISTPSWSVSARRRLGIAGAATVASIFPQISAASGSQAAGCRPVEVVVGMSGSERSARFLGMVNNTVTEAAINSLACESSLYVAAALGSQVVTVLDSESLRPLRPKGPNERVRRRRISGSEVRKVVAKGIAAALVDTAPSAGSSSLTALYNAAAEHPSGPETLVVVLSDGVQQDATANLNRPLAAGEGVRIANGLRVRSVNGAKVVHVGVGQVDATKGAPGTLWGEEVRAFSQQVCQNAKAGSCLLLSVADPAEVLR